MRIALLGGTGDIGEGLALRWAYDTSHDVVVGSRDPDKARAKAEEYETELDSRGVDCKITGFVNEMAADRADVVVLAVPPYHVRDLLGDIGDAIDGDDIVVTPAVGMNSDDDGFHYAPPKTGSVTALVRDTVPDEIPVVGGFHNLAADRLANLDVELDVDTLLVSDDEDAKDVVARLAGEIQGLTVYDAGGVANAPEVESLTPLLINLALNNEGMHDVGVRFR